MLTIDRSIPSPHRSRGWDAPPRFIALHTTENATGPGVARAVARYFAAPATQASAHYIVGPDAVYACVDEGDRAWHVGKPGNGLALGVEQVGFARYTADEWAAPPQQAMLANVVELLADICRRTGIPAVCLSVDDARAPGATGILTHATMGKAFGGSNHWDPGPHFPLDDVLARVRSLLDDDATAQTDPEIAATD